MRSRARRDPPSRDRAPVLRGHYPQLRAAAGASSSLPARAGRGPWGLSELGERKNLHLRRRGSREAAGNKGTSRPAPLDRKLPGSRGRHSQAPRRVWHTVLSKGVSDYPSATARSRIEPTALSLPIHSPTMIVWQPVSQRSQACCPHRDRLLNGSVYHSLGTNKGPNPLPGSPVAGRGSSGSLHWLF